MKPARLRHFAGAEGFTIVESIIVIVLMGIAAAGIISMQGTVFGGQAVNKQIQVGVQLMQECAELLLATRRANGYSDPSLAAGTSTACDQITLTNPTYAHPTATITDGNSSSITACPSAVANSCKLVSITQGGLTPITLMLVSY